jgi:methyl-accepting chemotaxis protein
VATDLGVARTTIDTINVGGDVGVKYIETAKSNIEEAKTRIEKVKGYIEEPTPNVNIASQEINAAAGYINQAIGYMQIVDRDLSTDKLITVYQRWADKKWNEYQFALSKVVRLSDHIRHNCPRN